MRSGWLTSVLLVTSLPSSILQHFTVVSLLTLRGYRVWLGVWEEE